MAARLFLPLLLAVGPLLSHAQNLPSQDPTETATPTPPTSPVSPEPQTSHASVALAQPYPLDRYQPLLELNPFTLITPENESTPNFAQNLSLLGIMRSGGKVTALLFDSETRTRFTVSEDPDPTTGLRIESSTLANRPDEVTLQLAKGSERATVRFNRDAMALAAGGGSNPGSPAPPGRGPPSTGQRPPPNLQPDGQPNAPQPRIIRRPIRRGEPIPGQ